MLAFVAATYVHKGVTQDPPGVETRWWDGTMASKEVRYPNGKLMMRAEFGDDGTTVITLREWNEAGALTHSKLRQKDGTVEEKVFSANGKILLLHKLWNGDELSFRAERTFWPDNGKLRMEQIMTEDGINTAESRQYDRQGNLSMERRIQDNADQVSTSYRDGKVVSRSIFKANGDLWEELLWDDGSLKMRNKEVRLNGDKESEGFTPKGTLLFKLTGNIRNSVREIYTADGKVRLRQIYRGWGLLKVEEVSLETGKVTRAFIIDENRGILGSIEKFRADGTLESVKKLEVGDKVVQTTEYDAAGKNIISQKPGGEREVIDQDIFLDELGLLQRSGGNQ
jgi:antitoxin component YwqK of YwqJK toxin-antitoxin module